MPLFACSRCQTVENTALGDYWSKRDAPLCSACSRGQWHGHFPQERADNGNWRPDSRRPDVTGFLESASIMPDEGFAPMNIVPGPCTLCGATAYPLSLGGPGICPSCDCGDFGLAKVKRQSDELGRLRAENERLRAALTAERQAIADKAREWAALYQPGSDGCNTFVLLAEWIEAREHRIDEQSPTSTETK